jgi:hypothetical protein
MERSRVHVIVQPDYGERLTCCNEPAWAADTPKNNAAIERMRSQQVPGITLFRVETQAVPEDWLVSILDEIELHQGEYSQSEPYSELFVTGTGLSATVPENALTEWLGQSILSSKPTVL